MAGDLHPSQNELLRQHNERVQMAKDAVARATLRGQAAQDELARARAARATLLNQLAAELGVTRAELKVTLDDE